MKRRHYILALFVDLLIFTIFLLCAENLFIFLTGLTFSLMKITLDEGHWFLPIFAVLSMALRLGIIYFYFIYSPYKNQQGTLGDVLFNIRLKAKGPLTRGFLWKRLAYAFILNIILFASTIYLFVPKGKKQTLHDNIVGSQYEHVRVIKNK